MKITHIGYRFEVSSMGLDTDEDNVKQTVLNYERAVKAAIKDKYPDAEIEMEGTYGTSGAGTEITILTDDEDLSLHGDEADKIQNIGQRVWDRQEFEWAEAE